LPNNLETVPQAAKNFKAFQYVVNVEINILIRVTAYTITSLFYVLVKLLKFAMSLHNNY